MTLKIVVFAPMQTARVTRTVALKAFSFQRSFRPNRMSRKNVSTLEPVLDPTQDQLGDALDDRDHGRPHRWDEFDGEPYEAKVGQVSGVVSP